MIDNIKQEVIDIIDDALGAHLPNKIVSHICIGAVGSVDEPALHEFRIKSRNKHNRQEVRMLVVLCGCDDYSELPEDIAARIYSRYAHDCDNYRNAIFKAKDVLEEGGADDGKD